MQKIIEKIRSDIPALFAGRELDQLTGKALRWRTILNLKCKGELPSSMFIRHGRKLLIDRDKLLDWWETQLTSCVNEKRKHD